MIHLLVIISAFFFLVALKGAFSLNNENFVSNKDEEYLQSYQNGVHFCAYIAMFFALIWLLVTM
jgi:hypothetical protein